MVEREPHFLWGAWKTTISAYFVPSSANARRPKEAYLTHLQEDTNDCNNTVPHPKQRWFAAFRPVASERGL